MRSLVAVATTIGCLAAGGASSQEVLENSVGMRLVPVAAGTFEMGSRDGVVREKPVHGVRITRPFLLGQTEVTQAQWERVMGTTPWKRKDFAREGPNVAVSNVSWDDAVAFCDRLTAAERDAGRLTGSRRYRLPTEAEWEYACRAGTATRRWFGDDDGRLGECAWYAENADDVGEKYVHDVGLKEPNPWGLHDMLGNVSEMCSDFYGERYYESSPDADPQGPATGKYRSIRGGSWASIPAACCASTRSYVSRTFRGFDVGFRVVCDAE